jgi:hypothetical protein
VLGLDSWSAEDHSATTLHPIQDMLDSFRSLGCCLDFFPAKLS